MGVVSNAPAPTGAVGGAHYDATNARVVRRNGRGHQRDAGEEGGGGGGGGGRGEVTLGAVSSKRGPSTTGWFGKNIGCPCLSRCMLLHSPGHSNSPEHRPCNSNAALARNNLTPNAGTCVTVRTSEQYGAIGGRMPPITYDGLQLIWNGNDSDALWTHRRQIERSSNVDT
eukprot:4303652-Pyramimonas_sp.AAC.1